MNADPSDTARKNRNEAIATRRLWAAVIALLIMIALLFAVTVGVHQAERDLSAKVDDLQSSTGEGQRMLIANRAVTCRLLIAVGTDVDPVGPCLTPETRQYYDPEQVNPTATLREQREQLEVLCQLLRAAHETSLHCPPDPDTSTP